MEHRVPAVVVVDRPVRQGVPPGTARQAGRAIRIASFGEVRPVSLHGFTKGPILGAPADPILRIELAEDVFDLCGMIRASVGGTFGIGGMGLVKPIAEGMRFSSLSLRFQPTPGGKGNKLIPSGIF